MIKAIMKAPKEHMREILDNSGKVYQTSGTWANSQGRSKIIKGLVGEGGLSLNLGLFLESKGNH